jgi:uncharacterized protein
MPYVARLTIYPIKALSACEVQLARVLPCGALQHDRRWGLFDDAGRVWNGKRTAAIHSITSRFDPVTEEHQVTLANGATAARESGTSWKTIENLLGDHLHGVVQMHENEVVGFPDDLDSPGPTIISTATLETIASWYPGLTTDSVRRRLRTNIEIGGVEPFWEDRLFRADRTVVPIQIGSVTLGGVNPCQRCVVPTRDPETGVSISGFQKRFSEQRAATLPPWSARSRFDHFYRVAINTVMLAGGVVEVGMEVVVEG